MLSNSLRRGLRQTAWMPATALLLAMSLLLGSLAGCGPPPELRPGLNDRPLLVEVYPGGYAASGQDQFIRLYNPTDRPVGLDGWSVGDARHRALFGPEAVIGPRQSLYVAREAAAFAQVMGAPPDYVWGTGGGAPALLGGAGLELRREEGLVLLRDGTGAQVDTLVYGAPPPVRTPGWRGPPVPTPRLGEVIDRAREEGGWDGERAGEYTRDTDTAADWKQGGRWLDLRIYRPGQTWFAYPTYTVSRVTAYAAPDSIYAEISRLFDGARESIDLNLYSFALVPLAEKLAATARRGVRVRLLLEGVIVGGLTDQHRYVARLVAEAGGEVRYQVNHRGMNIQGRYVFNHAKFAVIDGQRLFVQSENFGVRGTPLDPTYGNRGWGVSIEDTGLAAYLSRVFAANWNPGHGDLIAYQAEGHFGPPAPGFVPDREIPVGEYRHPFPALTIQGPVSVTPVLAPDHSLLETKGVIGLMRSARESLLIEQMYAQVNCRWCTQIRRWAGRR